MATPSRRSDVKSKPEEVGLVVRERTACRFMNATLPPKACELCPLAEYLTGKWYFRAFSCATFLFRPVACFHR
jgi:hypothetical protein